MQRAILTTTATLLAFALAGCPGKNPATTTKTTGTTAATKASTLIGSVSAPAGIVASGAGNLTASAGGSIVASGAGNIVASGAGNRALLATGANTLAGTVVILVNAATLEEVQRTKTDTKGGYSFTKLAANTAYRVLAAGLKDGKPVTLATVAKGGGKAADIDLSTTCTFMACVIKAGNHMADVDPAKFQTMVGAFAKSIEGVDPPDLSDPARLPHWLGCHMTGEIRAMMADTVRDMIKDAIGADRRLAGLPDLSGLTDGVAQQAGQAVTDASTAGAAVAQVVGDYASAQAKALGDAMGGLDLAKAAAQLDGCE